MSARTVFAGLLAGIALLALARVDQTVLYDKPSAYNRIIVTEERTGLRTLRFGKDGARQSVVKPGDPDHLALPYAEVMLVGLALSREPRRFLVVGLGGGTLPMFLRRHYPDADIDAVDIDSDVVEVAKKFFGFREDNHMNAHVDDGRRFVESTRRPYDVIFLDAFGAAGSPPHLTTKEFLESVRRAVAPGGVVVANVWSATVNRLYGAMVRTYQEVFDAVLILEVRGAGNMVLLALPRGQFPGRDILARTATNLSSAKRFPFDLGKPVQFGFVDARAKDQRARVLRDRDLMLPGPGSSSK